MEKSPVGRLTRGTVRASHARPVGGFRPLAIAENPESEITRADSAVAVVASVVRRGLRRLVLSKMTRMRRQEKGISHFCGCTCLPNPGGYLARVRLMPPPDSLTMIIYLLQFMCPWNDKARVRWTFHRDRSQLFRSARWEKTWTLRRPRGCDGDFGSVAQYD
jgi:hypothetical protein